MELLKFGTVYRKSIDSKDCCNLFFVRDEESEKEKEAHKDRLPENPFADIIF